MTVANQVNITCAVCHDPHGAENPNQLRTSPVNSDTLSNGYRYTNVGDGRVCMDCHKARRDAVTYSQTQVTSGNWGPHHSCLLYTSPSPRDRTRSRMPSSA